MKFSFALFVLSTFLFWSCSSNNQKGETDEGSYTPLENALNEIAKLPNFEPLSKEWIEEKPKKYGKIDGVVAPNADSRDEVLSILDNLSMDLLYYENRFGRDNQKIERYYIGVDSNGKEQMLYAFIGLGGNDLLVALYTGANSGTYKNEVDSYREYNETTD